MSLALLVIIFPSNEYWRSLRIFDRTKFKFKQNHLTFFIFSSSSGRTGTKLSPEVDFLSEWGVSPSCGYGFIRPLDIGKGDGDDILC